MFGFEDGDENLYLSIRTKLWLSNENYRARPKWCQRELWDCVYDRADQAVKDFMKRGERDISVFGLHHDVQLESGNIVPVYWLFVCSFADCPVFISASRLPDRFALPIYHESYTLTYKALRSAVSLNDKCGHPKGE